MLSLGVVGEYVGKIYLEAKADGDGYSEICHLTSAPLDFSHLGFDTLSFSDSDSFTLTFAEKEKPILHTTEEKGMLTSRGGAQVPGCEDHHPATQCRVCSRAFLTPW